MRIATIIAILVGCIVVAGAARRVMGLRSHLAHPRFTDAWNLANLLIGLFIGGYLAAAVTVWIDEVGLLMPMVAGFFLGVAVLCHLVALAAVKLISDVRPGDGKAGAKARAGVAANSAETRSPAAHPVSPARVAACADTPPGGARRMRKFVDPDGTARTQFPPAGGDNRVRRYSGTFRFNESAPSQVDAAPAPATILVVDDSPLNRSILESYLEVLGHRCILIGDGASALSVLETNNSIELVLLDYWLPDMEGIEILRTMKSSQLHKNTPVLMLSSEDDSETIAQCIEAGADDFLAKPFAPRLLQARIDASLNKSRFRARELQFMARLESERHRSEELLRVILPTPIAKELTDTNQVKPRRYENVAVMFADISGFTAYCDKQRPEDVLSHLQSIVIAFEQLAEQFHVQKIKTIGDSFMAASGLLKEVEDPVLRCVEMAMEMIKVVERAVPEWNLRIGVHIGPVVAGIVGRSQFLFDIWGDTVNTASRIEAMASENGICVSARAWEDIKDHVLGQSLGLVHAKGKGDLEVYQIDGLRVRSAVAVDDPAEVGGYTVH